MACDKNARVGKQRTGPVWAVLQLLKLKEPMGFPTFARVVIRHSIQMLRSVYYEALQETQIRVDFCCRNSIGNIGNLQRHGHSGSGPSCLGAT